MDVDNSNKGLLPGMVAEISLHLSGSDSTYVIPKKTLLSTAEGNFVIGEKGGEIAKRLPVQRGRDSGEHIEIFGQISSGDTLVLEASEEMRDGSRLQ